MKLLVLLLALLCAGCATPGEQPRPVTWRDEPSAPYHLLLEALGESYPEGLEAPPLGVASPDQVRAFLGSFPLPTDSTAEGEEGGYAYLETYHGSLHLVHRFRSEILVGVAGIIAVPRASQLPDQLAGQLRSVYGRPETAPFVFELEGETIETDVELSTWRLELVEITYRIPYDTEGDRRFAVLEFWHPGLTERGSAPFQPRAVE